MTKDYKEIKTVISIHPAILLTFLLLGMVICFAILAHSCAPKKAEAEVVRSNTAMRDNLAKVIIAEDHLGHSWEGMLDVFINRKRANETIWEVAKRSCAAYYRKSPAWLALQNPNGYEKIRIKQARKIVDRKLDNLLIGKRVDSVKGGTHWENIERFGVPYWATGMVISARQGRHCFYKR